jgi:AcrR family transcriptional regulator
MNLRTSPRPGGRSARVQASVHQAVRALLLETDRSELTVPLIAERAGVTPSTIYRRWGNLPDLLSDVALDHLRADAAPADTGSVRGDLQAWAEQYLDEMTSPVGLTLLHDVLAGSDRAGRGCQCYHLVAGQIGVMIERGASRQQAAPAVDAFMDAVVAPIIYRALFAPTAPTRAQVRALVERCVADAELRARLP